MDPFVHPEGWGERCFDPISGLPLVSDLLGFFSPSLSSPLIWIELFLLVMCIVLIVMAVLWWKRRARYAVRKLTLLIAKILTLASTAFATYEVAIAIAAPGFVMSYGDHEIVIATGCTLIRLFGNFFPVLCLTIAVILVVEHISLRGGDPSRALEGGKEPRKSSDPASPNPKD